MDRRRGTQKREIISLTKSEYMVPSTSWPAFTKYRGTVKKHSRKSLSERGFQFSLNLKGWAIGMPLHIWPSEDKKNYNIYYTPFPLWNLRQFDDIWTQTECNSRTRDIWTQAVRYSNTRCQTSYLTPKETVYEQNQCQISCGYRWCPDNII